MKFPFLILAVLALVSSAFAQNSGALNLSERMVQGTHPWVGTPRVSIFSRALLDSSGRAIMYGSDNPLDYIFPGANQNDGFNLTVRVTEPTAARVIVWPNASGTVQLSPGVPGDANAVSFTTNGILAEGATADAYETTISFVDPTADQTVSVPNVGVNSALMFSTLTTNTVDAANSIWFASNGMVMEGATADGFETTVTLTDPTADRTITLPNASGTVRVAQASTAVALSADNQVVTPGQANVIQLSSDNATATNRTFTLSATGAITGAIYIIVGPASNQCEIADTGIQVLSATWSPTTGDSLTLLFDGTSFIELARAANH